VIIHRCHGAQHRRQCGNIYSERNPNRRCAKHNLNDRCSAWARRQNRRSAARLRRIHNDWRKRHIGPLLLSAPRIPAPAEQLLRRQPMSARNRAHRLATRATLSDDPNLLLRRPAPTAASPREYLYPLHSLRFKQKLSVRYVSNRDSAIRLLPISSQH
jgi:hypothetical protein